MDLYICTTYYHLYVLLLKRLTGHQRKCDVVICDDIPTGKALSINLKKSGLFKRIWYIEQSKLPDDRGYGRLDRILFQHRRRYKMLSRLLPFDVKSYDNIYIFHDDTPLGRLLNDAHKKYHLIEDSYNFFQRIKDTPQAIHLRKKNYKYPFAKLLNSGYFPMGESKFVIDIEVNENLSLQIKGKKIFELSRDAMRAQLSKEDRCVMYKIFGCPVFPVMSNKQALLLTEPLALDGVCDESTQYDIYSYIVSDLKNKDFDVLIKPHPRDNVDYSKLQAFITEKTYPVELFVDCLEQPLCCVAAVSSSAVYSIHAKKIYLYSYLINGGQKDV